MSSFYPWMQEIEGRIFLKSNINSAYPGVIYITFFVVHVFGFVCEEGVFVCGD